MCFCRWCISVFFMLLRVRRVLFKLQPLEICLHRGDVKSDKEYQHAYSCMLQTVDLPISVIPHNCPQSIMKVQHFGCQTLGFEYCSRPGHWCSQWCCFTEQPCLSFENMLPGARASTDTRTYPRPYCNHLVLVMPFLSPSVSVLVSVQAHKVKISENSLGWVAWSSSQASC